MSKSDFLEELRLSGALIEMDLGGQTTRSFFPNVDRMSMERVHKGWSIERVHSEVPFRNKDLVVEHD
jgi:hypothetical protein